MPPGPQRDVIKDTIKKTQESIEGIKKDLEAATLAAKSATVGMKKSKEETQKVNKFLSIYLKTAYLVQHFAGTIGHGIGLNR